MLWPTGSEASSEFQRRRGGLALSVTIIGIKKMFTYPTVRIVFQDGCRITLVAGDLLFREKGPEQVYCLAFRTQKE